MYRFALLVLLMASSAFGQASLEARARKYALDAGATPGQAGRFTVRADGLHDWEVPGVPAPTPAQLAAVESPEIGSYGSDAILKDPLTGKYRLRTETDRSNEVAAAKAAFQAAKSLTRRKLENRYIRICNDVLVILADPRVGSNALIPVADLSALLDLADTKNQDKALAKATRQLVVTLNQLDRLDPNWFANLQYDPGAGE